MKVFNKITFLKALITEDKYLSCYKTISFKSKIIKIPNVVKEYSTDATLIRDIPDYLKTEKKPSFLSIHYKTISGHLINLKNFDNCDDYLAQQFSAKSRNNLKRRLKKLNKCFNIRVKTYYGSITQQEYDTYFIVLKELLSRRFSQKQEYNYEIQYLEEFHSLCFDLICKKKANMLVIFNGNDPISIRINMFLDNMAFYIISGYNIDYSKFNLGSIDMIKNIEWCINNKFEVYDLLKGYDYYKKKWSTTLYYNHTQLLIPKSKWWLYPAMVIINIKNRCKFSTFRVIKRTNIYTSIKKIKKVKFALKHKEQDIPQLSEKKKSNKGFDNFEVILYKEKDYAFLKKHVHDFLFETNENLSNITLHHSLDNTNHYQIIGDKVRLFLIFNQKS
ncbi:GNAT family N-acetyltransferase [Hyunsoonleella ulvae]|uniref:GNAT family N-acetyltransferase n=1 Tax=Hyunsoonleella ulvae TaxID=2799948 RepID=UPI00193A2BE3|nr:GNAT family N-acetyltransferase [Hyunsoonleella ulvae]